MFTVKIMTSQTDKGASFRRFTDHPYAFNAFFAVQDEEGKFVFMVDTSYEMRWWMVREVAKPTKFDYGQDVVEVWTITDRESVNRAIAVAFNKAQILGMHYKYTSDF